MKKMAILVAFLSLLALGAGPMHDPDDVNNFGSGSFGNWGYDEDNSFLLYSYTMNPSDPRAYWDPKVAPVTNLHWHQIGNGRINANAYNLGFVKLFYGETGAYWLNEYEPEKNEFSGGFGWIIDGSTVIIDRAGFDPEGKNEHQGFWTGYYERSSWVPGYLSYKRLIGAPLGSDRPYLLSLVGIENQSNQEKEITLIEYWDVNIHLIDDFLLAGKLPDKVRDNRMDVDLEDSILWAFPHVRPQDGKAPREPALVYPYLPSVFFASPDQAPEAWIINPQELFKNGEPLRDPEKLLSAGVINPQASALAQNQLCLAARFKLRLHPNESKWLTFAYGYRNPLDAQPKISHSELTGSDKALYDLQTKWIFTKRPFIEIPGHQFLDRELFWDYYYLTSSAIYDAYYQKHYIPQGGNYLYYSGGNGATRDYAAFVMTLAYYKPELACEILEFMMRAQEADGRLFYDLEGFGKRYTIPYRPGDLDLWFLWALSEYVFATRDFAFLDTVQPFYPLGHAGEATVYEHARRSLDHLIDIVSVGPHGHPRLKLSDWNDEMTFLTSRGNLLDVVATIGRGESVLNTAMACYIMPMVADLARVRGDEKTAKKAENYLEGMRKALRSAWYEDHLIRSYSGFGKPFGTDVIYLEPQVWALLAGDVLDGDQTKTLINTINERLIKTSDLGMIISNSTSGSFTTRKGEQEEGGIWLAINGPGAVALSKYDRQLGWDQVIRNTLAWHAEMYPNLWYGIWSGPDAWNSLVSDRPGETWYMKSAVMNTGPQMYPIQNAHSHSQTMWAVAKLAGIEPTADGWSIEPRIPRLPYSFSCALFDLDASDDSISGAARPTGKTVPMKIRVLLPPAWSGAEVEVAVGGAPAGFERVEDRVVFTVDPRGNTGWSVKVIR